MSKNYCPYCMAAVPEGESCSVCGLTSGTYVPSPHHLPPGTILMDRYLVGRVLGEGGFGITYIGRDLRLELKVAIKEYYPVDRATRNASASLEVTNFIGPSAKSFERGKQKFLGEAQVMARMDKQQVIVSVRDFFEINNTAYIVMEYIEGITFHELVQKKGGKIPPEELFPMIEPLFHALTIMHENGLIHRDISPDNLMLESGKIRLLDFGCAREASRGTETMTIALKHGYAPIEQYQQKGQGPWTDIYALSATIYYCLTGKIPPQALDRITEDELLLPSKLGVSLSPTQEKALLKGMRLQPSRRYATAQEMWAALYTDKEETYTDKEETKLSSYEELAEKQKQTAVSKEQEPADHEEEQQEIPETENVPATAEKGSETEVTFETEEVSEAEKVSEAEESFEEPEGKPEVRPEKNGQTGKFGLIAGVAAALILVAVVIGISVSGSKKEEKQKQTLASVDGKSENTAADQRPAEAVRSEFYDPDLFEGAYEFKSGNEQGFRNLMKDHGVTAIIINCDNLDVSDITITKPVLLAKDTYLAADNLTITDRGYLQVEGHLDVSGSSYLRLTGKQLRLFIADEGEFTTEDTFLWMDDEVCYMGKESEEISGHRLVFSEEIFDEARSVTDMESFNNAINDEEPISIDGDITLTDNVYLSMPVRISEGVTVSSEGNNHDEGRPFVLVFGNVLVNNGTIYASINTNESGTAFINNGTLGPETSASRIAASFWVEKESVLVNFGTVNAWDTSRMWTDSLLMNMGTLNCNEACLSGGRLTNFGSIILSGQDHYFDLFNNGKLWNKKEAVISVADNALFFNRARIHNQGSIIIEKDGLWESAVLSNDGRFEVKAGGNADEGRTGIYYGAGEFLTGNADILPYKVYEMSYYMPETWENLVLVRSAQELEEALENPDAEAVCVKADILAEKDLTIRKSLFIDKDCSLSMPEGTKLMDYGNCLILLSGGTLQADHMILYEKAQIYMEENSDLVISEGGILTLDSSLLWGNGGRIKMNGAELTLKNKGGFALINPESMEAAGGKITLQDGGVFTTPEGNSLELNETAISMEDNGGRSCFYAASDLNLKDCSLNIGSGSVFRNSSGDMTLENCSVTIDGEGEFISENANLSLLSGTTMENGGRMFLFGWDEYNFTVHGKIRNLGYMEIGIVPDLSEPIDNQGELYYFDSYKNWDGFDRNVTGNAPIDRTNA